jgi:hypothetical protein
MRTFATLEPGTVLGEHAFTLSDDAVCDWTALFPADAECLPTMPPAMMAAIIMRAFVTVLHDRPHGNIHAGQKFRVVRLPRLHDRLLTRLRCEGKEFRNGRRWVTFVSETNDQAGGLLFRGEMTTLWAQ